MCQERRGTAVVALAVLLLAAVAAACGDREPDPRTVPGALAAALAAADAHDGRALYKLVDQRARRSICAVLFDRHAARDLVRAHYPDEARGPTLADLGDAAEATDAADLFARRCDAACFRWYATALAAPEDVAAHGAGDVVVRTARGTTLHMHRGSDGWWGVTRDGENERLAEEALDAGRDRAEIEEAARVYDRRRDLATPLGGAP
jgi:hypothetical protein